MAQQPRKSELIAQLAQARQKASVNLGGLSRDLNVAHRLETTFQRHRLAFLGGASGFGFLLARLSARPKKVIVERRGRKDDTQEKVVKAGLLVTVLKIAFDLSRPLLTKWVTRKVTTYAAERFGSDLPS